MYHVPDGDGGRAAVYQHQLVALLEFDPSEVFADDTHTHHEMGSPISIDIPENLDILDDREHIRLHAGGGDCSHPELVLADVFGERINFQSQKQSKLHHWTHRLREANTTASAD